jgi:ribosomal protein S12 methylthiotransferase accessory factor
VRTGQLPLAKAFTQGTHRTAAPAATFEWLAAGMHTMGITRVANITGLDELGIPVAAAYRPNSRAMSIAQGKGIDLPAAKTSALMESIEGWHAERIEQPLELASYEQLRVGRRVADVARLPSVRGSRFHEHLQLPWIEARNLCDELPTWVPYEIVHTDYTLPLPPGSGCFQASSNGLAGGNHPTEAASHAICELIERDATALWQLRSDGERRAGRVDLRTVTDGDCLALLERYAASGVEVAAWETTTDIEIPCFTCVICPRHAGPDDHLLVADGMGCHPARAIALFRALVEAAQSRLTVIAGARDDLRWDTYNSAATRAHAARLRAMLEARGARRPFPDGPDPATATLDGDLHSELHALASAGLDEVLRVDLTRADRDIPVVRVAIPGLEGVCFQPGYRPGARVRALLTGAP